MPQRLHHHTPTLGAQDPRGLTVREVAYHRRSPEQTAEARITRQVYSATGFLHEQWDPRLYERRQRVPTTEPNQRTQFTLSGRVLRTDNVDSGHCITWRGAGNLILDTWDASGIRHSHEYDDLMRLKAVFEQGPNPGPRRCTERFSYAGANAGDAALNRCGRVWQHEDPSGVLTFERYDINANVVAQARRFIEGLSQAPMHAPPPALPHAALEALPYMTQWRYGALGQLLAQHDAKGNVQLPRYGIDGRLSSMAVRFNQGQQRLLLQERRYTASGNVETEQAGNGVRSTWTYDPMDERLLRCKTQRSRHPRTVLQDLTYTYDRTGLIVSVNDGAQPVEWSDNTHIEASSHYAYDTLYQLIEATGREHARHTGGATLPPQEDFAQGSAQRRRGYHQHYRYDASGNLISLRHTPTQGSGYTRHLNLSNTSNHGVAQVTGVVKRPGRGRGFDHKGNQLALERGQSLHWNARDQLLGVTHIVRVDADNDDEIYRYDGNGQRVYKARRSRAHNAVHLSEVRYLPGLEIRRDTATGEWLNVLVVNNAFINVRILQWEQGRPTGMQDGQVRYSLADYQGNHTLELDQDQRLLSQEHYYPYGGTAWWATHTAIEATYKTVRFSGKERDASGLYAFGLRYYAPWLMRWISADPAGDVDGLNRYAFARGNPINRVDADGLQSNPVEAPKARFATLRGITTHMANRVRSRVQLAGSAAIRYALATYISNALSAGLDVALFEGRQPTAALNTALRNTVAALDALAMMHMSSGLLGNIWRWSPLIGFAVAAAADRGFMMQGLTEGSETELEWDPVARMRLGGHIRAFSREIVQQVLRGLGDTASWGQTPLTARVPRTLLASAAYAVATVPNAMYAAHVPGPITPNIGPLIEAYDAAAGTLLRSGHRTVRHDVHQQTLQLPPAMDTLHGGISRMFNQTWTYWVGVGIEAVAGAVTGAPPAAQSARARTWVSVARGVVSALTEVRGLLLQTARAGFGNIGRLWRPSAA